MKTWLSCLASLLAALTAPAAPHPLHVLFLGHEDKHHDSAAYLPLLMEKFGRDAIYFDYYTKPDCLTTETLAPYDAVMLYANHETIQPAQFAALEQFVQSGHGFLPLHCASACFTNEPKFAALVGGRFKSHATGIFKAHIVEPNHPVMQGVHEYETWDETYVHDLPNPVGRTVLAMRENEPWTWVRSEGAGRVFYTASGHDERTWGNADFQLMLRNAIVWSVGDRARGEWEKFLAQREPEKREPNPNVANYEKRAQAITFQHPLSVKGSMERTQVPADMHLELFASEPQIMKPIAMAWDERGRLWVAETRDYPHGVRPGGEGNDDIKICEDTDGDGKADKFTIFADKLNLPTSLTFAHGGVIVAQPPRFLFLKSTKGDDHADVRQVLIEGWGISDTHAQASNLHWGYDNWVYGCVGYSGFRGTVGGRALNFGMGTYRFRPDGSGMEFLHQFTNNSWGQSFNAAGDDFGGTANNAPIFFGGLPARIAPEGMRVMTAKKINVENKAHAITPNHRQVDVFGGYIAAAGTSFIYSASLPPRLQGKAMVCEPTMKIVSLMDVEPQGAGFVAKDAFNLVASSDEWMSPVCAEVGPDGAVWVADWENFIIQHNPTPSVAHGGYDAKTGPGGAHENPLRDHSLGRIYRVVWNQAKQPRLRTLAGADTDQLVAALGNDTQFWRLTAQRLLVEGHQVAAVPALQKLVRANDGQVAAVHALWALQGLGQLDPATQQAALAASDPALRRNALRTLGAEPAAAASLVKQNLLFDRDPAVRLAAMAKVAEFSPQPELAAATGRLAADPAVAKDEWLNEALKVLEKKQQLVVNLVAGANLLPNGGFEEGAALPPAHWTSRNYRGEAEWSLESGPGAAHGGHQALHVVSRRGADSSYFVDLPVKPQAEYRLSGWIRTKGVRGARGALLNVHLTEFATPPVSGDQDWTKVSIDFNSGKASTVSINALFGGYGSSTGEAWFDDLQLQELIPGAGAGEAVAAGDPQRGEQIFFKHPTVACVLCHSLHGQGSTVGPALDGIATRATAAYLTESLLEPNKVLAKGYENLGTSPMPPMGVMLKPQELEDIKAFLQTLK